MLTRVIPSKVYQYQLLTLGFYFFHWCARSGGEINRTLGRRECPSAWWFVLPFGGYWWMWQYANALHELSQAKIKLADTFTYYIIAANAWLILPAIDFGGFTSGNNRLVWELAYAVCILVIAVLGHGFFCASIQAKINSLSPSPASASPQNLPKQG